jgi:hypothetical protein
MINLTPPIDGILQSIIDAPSDSSVGQLRDSEMLRLGISIEEAATLIFQKGIFIDSVFIPEDSDE